MAALCEREGYAPGSGPELDHRTARLGGELLPERQVERVGAELDLLPELGLAPLPGALWQQGHSQ